MSFSSLVKDELCRITDNEKCCLKAELAAIVAVGGIIGFTDSGIVLKIVTENAVFARRVYSLFKELYGVTVDVKYNKGKKLKKHTSYIITISDSRDVKTATGVINDLNILVYMDDKTNTPALTQDTGNIIVCDNCERSYLRGAFLAGGSISNPEKTYHVELTSRYSQLASQIRDMIADYNLNAKIIKRKGYYVIYLKEGDNIVDLLNIIGAHSALMDMENVRILKDMRNNVNRMVNCETANLEKTVNASVRQIQNIEFIRDNIGFDKLPKNLKEVAELRLKYSDASLKELGEMLDPPLGKSGVNHRLRRLEKIARDFMAKEK